MDHPLYLPDLAPSDYKLFLKLQENHMGKCSSNDELMQTIREVARKGRTKIFSGGCQDGPNALV